MFLMWLGEQITARGVGNGISLIIFAGIVAALPVAVAQLFELSSQGSLSAFVLILLLVVMITAIVVIVFMERAQRRLLVQYPKRQVGNRMFQGDSSHLPLEAQFRRCHSADLRLVAAAPADHGGAVLRSAGQAGAVAGCSGSRPRLVMVSRLHMLIYVMLIIFFCFFYTAVVFNPQETADNLRKYGGFLPGYRPGEQTAKHIDYVLTRITVVGAIYLARGLFAAGIMIANAGVPLHSARCLGGTSLLIAVSVTMDTVAQIQSHLVAHQYEGLIQKSKLRGGGGKPGKNGGKKRR